MALRWQFDSDFIIRAWFYNKQGLSCSIRHAWRRSPSPRLAPPPLPHRLLLSERRAKLPTVARVSLPLSLSVCLGKEQEGSRSIDLTH